MMNVKIKIAKLEVLENAVSKLFERFGEFEINDNSPENDAYDASFFQFQELQNELCDYIAFLKDKS
jgi:hypothetical protein